MAYDATSFPATFVGGSRGASRIASMAYLPRIARRLYHARDLGEPFDFLTWFELAPERAGAFEDLVGMLREREEWRYVVRLEVME